MVNGCIFQSQIGTGGAGPIGGLTGSVQFNDGGVHGGDATELFWDNTSKELGIGTGAPETKLHIFNDSTAQGTTDAATFEWDGVDTGASAAKLVFSGAAENNVRIASADAGSGSPKFLTLFDSAVGTLHFFDSNNALSTFDSSGFAVGWRVSSGTTAGFSFQKQTNTATYVARFTGPTGQTGDLMRWQEGNTVHARILANGGAIFNDNASDSDFTIESTNNANMFFVDASTDRIGINQGAPAGKIHVDQSSTTAAIPVVILDQADVSEEFVRFIGTAAAADVTQSLVAEADVTTATRAGFVRVYVQDDGNQIADQAYYQPVFTLT